MALKELDDSKQDERFNPSGEARDLYRQEHEAIPGYDRKGDGLDDHPVSAGDASGDSTQEGASIANVKRQEEDNSSWKTNVTGATKQVFKGKGLFKSKRNNTLVAIAIVLAGGAGFSVMIVPGIGLIHLKETFMNKLDDQALALNSRSIHVMSAKVQGGASFCSNVINIRCKFSSLSDKRIDKLGANGFAVEKADSKIPGRSQVKTMTFTDKSGTKHVINNPGDMRKLLASSGDARSGFRTAFNSRFENMSGKAFSSLMRKIPGINKRQKIPDTTDKAKISKAIASAAQGKPINAQNNAGAAGDDDSEDVKKEKAQSGNYTEAIDEEAKKVASSGVKASTSILQGGMRGVGILGVADSACVVKNSIKAVESGAKVIRAAQLANFAMIFLTMADAMKAGDVTPNQVETVGNILTATDNRKTIEYTNSDGVHGEQANPYYKKSAFDSVGYRMAAYGDKPSHNVNTIQYLAGGTPALGALSGINNALAVSNSTCAVITNPLVRAASGIVGIVVGIGSFGTSLAVSVGGSLAISAALPYIQSLLIDMVAGVAVDENTIGPAAGDAITSGTTTVLGTMAQANGMQPSDGSAAAIAYAAGNTGAVQDDIQYQTEIAKSDTLDIYNPYSMLGMMSSAIYPTVATASTSGASALASLAALPTTALKTILPTANVSAAGSDSGCSDPGYEAIGLQPGGMCQLNYYMTSAELSMDSFENVEWMLSSDNIDDQGVPQGKYADFMKNCVERMNGSDVVPFGESIEDITNGSECIDSSDNTMENISHFRVFTLDSNISDSMDYEAPVAEVKDPEVIVEEPNNNVPDVIVSSGEWTRPIKKGGGIFISSRYMTPSRPTHNGVDFAAPMETPYYAAADGVVSKIEKRQAFAGARATQYIVINHGGGVSTEYGHSYPDQIKVSVGDTVKAGQVISLVGNQGNIITSRGTPSRSNGFGAHLHFNYVINGKTVNPETAMKKHGITL